MKKFLGLFLSLALTLSMFSGFALADETDLSSLTFGNGWKIDTSKEYVGDQYKRFDGLEFTRIVNTSGFDLPEGMTHRRQRPRVDVHADYGLAAEDAVVCGGRRLQPEEERCHHQRRNPGSDAGGHEPVLRAGEGWSAG